MKFGTGFPLRALGDDAVAVRDFAQTLEGARFDFVTMGGHLLSAEPNRFPQRPNPTYVGPFHEPFVLSSYLAGVTSRLTFLTSILILPEMPTAIVAKQAAELSLLSGGRFELGVGISWNAAEYQALGQDFHTRGKRLEEQIMVLRRLWSEPFVTFEGRWHKLDRVGLNRLPKLPIPIWIGSGNDDRLLRRIARLADGWMPSGDPSEPVGRLRHYLTDEGRDMATLRFLARLTVEPGRPKAWIEAARKLMALGATHLAIGAPPSPDLSPSQAMETISEARKVLAQELGT